MKLWKIFRFEFAYQVGSIPTWLYLLVLLIFTISMDVLTTPGDGVYVNNTFHITAITVIGILIWLIMGATIAGEAAARDVQTRMYPLTSSTPVTKFEYLGGRFLAAFTMNALLILSLPLGVLISFYMPGMNEDVFGPFMPLAYLNVYFLIALPTTFIATAIQFTFAALSRQVMASYIASLLLAIFAQIIAIGLAKLFGNWNLVELLDPVGVTGIMGSELQKWTPTEKNTRLITLEGMYLWNRILWVSIAVGLLMYTYLRYNFDNTKLNNRLNRKKHSSKVPNISSFESKIIPSPSIFVPQVTRRFDFSTFFHQMVRIAGASFAKIAKNPVGFTLVGLIAVVSALFGDKIMTQFGIPLIPTTPQVIDYLTAPIGNIDTPFVIIPSLIMYFTGELVWSERETGIRDITDAMPVPEWTLLTGKFLGLGFVIIVWMALIMAGGILMQLILGYTNLDISLYLKVLFGLQLVDYLLFALLALVIHVVVNQKYVGYLVVFIVFIFIVFPSSFGVQHKMLIFGVDPGWSYTDMRGFGSSIEPWLWFKGYWIAVALLLAVTARLFWARGREQNLKYRLQLARNRFTHSTIWVAIIALALVFLLGGFIFYNTNVLNDYITGSQMMVRKAEYERLYGQYRNISQPQLTATKLKIELYPEQQQADIYAAYTLVNQDSVPIGSIHIGSSSGIAFSEVNFNRVANGVIIDKTLNHHIYVLEQPLRPGDSLELSFEVRYKQKGFMNNSTNPLVVDNGTYFTNYNMLPSIGYQSYREIKDAVTRKKYNLPARPIIPSLYDPEARKKSMSPDQTTFEALIGTAKDEIAVAPGALIRNWTESSRRYFHYKTNASIGSEYAILSGDYSVLESEWNDVEIKIYYHPNHDQNIDRMLRSVKASLEYYTEQFGPYPYGYITVTERAGQGGGATADAGIIYYGEQYPLMDPDDSPEGFDLPYYILAHEVAHQWWGLAILSPAYVEGAGVLVEGLAVYSGMKVLEKNYGDGHVRKFLSYLHSFYEMPRSLATASLLQANEEFLSEGWTCHVCPEQVHR